MWQPMDGHLQPRIPHGRGMCQLCFASLHCGLVWYSLALCSMVQFGLVCELCTSCAAHQRPRQCGHNLFASPPHPSYPCLSLKHSCLQDTTSSFLSAVLAFRGGLNFWLIWHIQLISVSANHCLRLQCLVVSIIQRVQISVSSNLNLERLTLEPASHEFGAYAVEKHQLGGSHSGKVSRRRESGQATLEVGHVTI